MRDFALVGLGGALGSMLRYGTGLLLLTQAAHASFPVATLTVNVLGSFVMGALLAISRETEIISGDAKLLLMTGVLGGYTTFSAFSGETFALLKQGDTALGVLNFVLNPLLSLLSIGLGFAIASWLLPKA